MRSLTVKNPTNGIQISSGEYIRKETLRNPFASAEAVAKGLILKTEGFYPFFFISENWKIKCPVHKNLLIY